MAHPNRILEAHMMRPNGRPNSTVKVANLIASGRSGVRVWVGWNVLAHQGGRALKFLDTRGRGKVSLEKRIVVEITIWGSSHTRFWKRCVEKIGNFIVFTLFCSYLTQHWSNQLKTFSNQLLWSICFTHTWDTWGRPSTLAETLLA